jgi:outer membrane murein-binding lipoprotein Lpp
MKKIILSTLILSTLLVACNNEKVNKLPSDAINILATADSSNQTNQAKPAITFEEDKHNFGIIKEGDFAEYSFKFNNTGNGDLLIANATASCGCTVPEYPKGIIKAGEEGFIKVKFDSKGKVGMFEKTITITCNTEVRETVLTIGGEVVK